MPFNIIDHHFSLKQPYFLSVEQSTSLKDGMLFFEKLILVTDIVVGNPLFSFFVFSSYQDCFCF